MTFDVESFHCDIHDKNDFDINIDPDVNYYKEFRQESRYITDEKFIMNTQNVKGFFLIHFNCRSIKSNFVDLK